MTANVTIVTARRDDVMRIPLQALRFRPRKAIAQAAPDGPVAGRRPSNQARVWLDQGGALKPVTVTSGLDDGNYVEILSGDLKVGDMVVTDETRTAGSARGGSSPLKMSRY
jgi:HlyD family secretion protein